MKKFLFKHSFVAAMIALVLVAVTAAFLHPVSIKGGIILANTFLTTQLIAREALVRLRNMLVMKALIHNDYSSTFQKQGDTIRVKKPATYVADEFGGTINLQTIGEDSVNVVLNHIADVSIAITSKEKALNIDDFGDQYLNPAMEAIAQKVDADIMSEVYKEVPFFVGVSGTTPSALDDFANARKILNINRVPQAMRRAVWDPNADAKFTVIPSIVNAEKSGSTLALREGSIGRIQGLDNYMSQNVVTHAAGTFTAVAAPKVNTLAVVDSNTIILKGGAGTETIKKGDCFYVTSAGKNYYYSAAADAAAVAGVVSVTTFQKVQAAHAVDDVIVFPDKTAGGHVSNLAFHRNAFAFVQRPLEAPAGGATGYTVNFEGLSLRVVQGYNISTKVETLSMDILYGIKAIYPQLATRVLG